MQTENVIEPGATPRLRHSELGIAALIVTLLNIACLFGCFGFLVMLRINNQELGSGITMLVGLGIFAAFVAGLLGLVMGLVGVIQPGRKKLFAWLGLGFSVAVVAFTALFVVPAVIHTVR